MQYTIPPFGPLWTDGVFFTVPTCVADRYLKLASAYQLQALLLLLRHGAVSAPGSWPARWVSRSETQTVLWIFGWPRVCCKAATARQPLRLPSLAQYRSRL